MSAVIFCHKNHRELVGDEWIHRRTFICFSHPFSYKYCIYGLYWPHRRWKSNYTWSLLSFKPICSFSIGARRGTNKSSSFVWSKIWVRSSAGANLFLSNPVTTHVTHPRGSYRVTIRVMRTHVLCETMTTTVHTRHRCAWLINRWDFFIYTLDILPILALHHS